MGSWTCQIDSIRLELTWGLRNRRWLGWPDLVEFREIYILDMLLEFLDFVIDLGSVRVCDDHDLIEIWEFD